MTEHLDIGARRFAGRVWQLARPYWTRSEERGLAWVLVIAIISISLGLVYLSVILNKWNREFFNSLESKSYEDFRDLLLCFCFIAAIYITAAVYRAYLRQMLEMRWRIWLTREYLGEWTADQIYYRLEQDARGTDNPDQRIADDLRSFTSTTLALTLDLLQQVVTLVSFVIILWGVSGALTFTLGGTEWTIPGYMVWAALLYALAGSVVTYYIGRPLIGLNFQQERYEADLRFSLVRMREYAEGIALYRGEPAENQSLARRVEQIRLNWWGIMRASKRLNFFTNGYGQVAIVFPYFVAAPRYFSGAMPLGGLTQIASAFGTVQEALSWFVSTYPSLASWKASVDRLLTFHNALHEAGSEAREHRGVRVETVPAQSLSAERIHLALPGGRILLADASFQVQPGERVLISGASGSGKSTLFRAIAGLWAYGSGTLHVPAGASALFLPQKPYIPIGTLRGAVAYPSRPEAFPDALVRETLEAVRLGHFADRLDEARNWSTVMSGGEQQKLAIARVLLARPQWLFLDEATAALDEDTERLMYDLLRQRLPDTAVLSIAHRPQLAAHHDRRLVLADGKLQSIEGSGL